MLLLAAAALLVSSRAVFAGTITGRVLDAGGKPVVGTRVAWRPYRTDDETLLDETLGREAAAAGEAAADDQGRFRDTSETVELADVHLPGAARLTGRVSDDAGKPVPGARVLVMAGGGGASEEDA